VNVTARPWVIDGQDADLLRAVSALDYELALDPGPCRHYSDRFVESLASLGQTVNHAYTREVIGRVLKKLSSTGPICH
jgi:hypothetical protein